MATLQQQHWTARHLAEASLWISSLDENYRVPADNVLTLTNWETVATVTNTTGTVEYSEPLPTSTRQQYYRAKLAQ